KVFSHRNIPLVFMDVGAPGPGVSRVRVDHAAGVAMAMDHLVELGHTRIAFISGPLELFSARTRFQAFLKSLEKHGLKRDQALIQEANHRADGGHHAMQRILDSGAMPTAIVASNDLTAIGAMGAIHERGLRIPEDISIVGYDDIQLSAYTQPSLTTLRLPRIEIATAAFRALYNLAQPGKKKPHDGEDYDVQPTLILRKSTGRVARQQRIRQ